MAVKFFFTGIVLIISSLGVTKLTSALYHGGLSMPSCMLCLAIGTASVICILTGMVLIFISTRRTSKYHTLFTSLRHFVIKYHRLYVGARMLNKYRSACKTPRSSQERLLQDIIRKNKDTDYGRRFRLEEIKCLEDLREKHPLTSYSHFEQYVERVARGENNVMTSEKVSRFCMTSGTTGTPKKIPQDTYYFHNNYALREAFQQEVFPDLHPMQGTLKIHCNTATFKTEDGTTITSASAFERRMLSSLILYTPPSMGLLIETVHEAFYVGALFALRDKELGSVSAPFVGVLVDWLRFMEQHWPQLVEDLSKGQLHSDLDLPQDIRSSLTKSLGSGDHQRAMEVKQECEKGFDGIMNRLWPNLQYIAAIDNIGVCETLKQSQARGLPSQATFPYKLRKPLLGVEMYSALYGCSEGVLGHNLWPFDNGIPEYALTVGDIIFEFIREDDIEKPNPKTFFVDEIEVGQNYEISISQSYGFYRYRLGDVIQVSGFYQNCPKVRFLYRTATLLNLIGEKVSQTCIQDALSAVLGQWKDHVKLKHYCVAESPLVTESKESHKKGLHYCFFLELQATSDCNHPDGLNPETLSESIHNYLREHHVAYEYFFTETKQIKPPTVYLTKDGAFDSLKEYILSHSTTSRAQFKIPLRLRTAAMVTVMLENCLP